MSRILRHTAHYITYNVIRERHDDGTNCRLQTSLSAVFEVQETSVRLNVAISLDTDVEILQHGYGQLESVD